MLLEAGLAGLAVVATRVGGVPDIIEDGKTGLLVRPKNPEELAQKIEVLRTNPVLRQKLGQNLRQKVLAEFSTARMVDETVKLYNQ